MIRSFEYEGRNLEARTRSIPAGYEVRVYENGQPVSSTIYTVSEKIVRDAAGRQHGYDVIAKLLEDAEHDFIQFVDRRSGANLPPVYKPAARRC
jgi:hypothetical protein